MKKGFCKKGHVVDGDNAYVRTDGRKACKICTQERVAKRRNNPELYQHDKDLMKKNYYENHEERKKINRERWNKNKEKNNKQQRESFPAKLKALKTEVLTYYGNGRLRCVCCGESDLVFLTLDHINGREENDRGWNKKKKAGRVLWSYVKREGFPEGYQTLCWNCNSGRQVNKGICPHKQVQTIPAELTKITINRL